MRETEGTIVDCLNAAEEVLRESGKPLHHSEIVRRAKEGGLQLPEDATPGLTLTSAIDREIGTDGDAARFVRHGTGVYGLREWGPAPEEADASDEAHPDEPLTLETLEQIRAQVAHLQPPPTASEGGPRCGTVYLQVKGSELCLHRRDGETSAVDVLADELPGGPLPEKVAWLREHIAFEGANPGRGDRTAWIHLWSALKRARILTPREGDVLAWVSGVTVPEGGAMPSDPSVKVLDGMRADARGRSPRPTSADEWGRENGTVYLCIEGCEFCASKPESTSNRLQKIKDDLPGKTLSEKLRWLERRVDYHRASPNAVGLIQLWRTLRHASIRNPGPDDVLAWSEPVNIVAAEVDVADKAPRVDRNWEQAMHKWLGIELRDMQAFQRGQYAPPDLESRLPFWVELCYRADCCRTAVELATRLSPEDLDSNPRLRQIVHAAEDRAKGEGDGP